MKLAEDGNGRRLDFGNMSFSGGMYWKYADTAEVGEEECGDVVCMCACGDLISARARPGGITIEWLLVVGAGGLSFVVHSLSSLL